MAGYIPQEFIQTLLARTDIVEIIQEVVPLKRKGMNFSTCCPFHDEKTPSFIVKQDKQFYHCFGCGANGTAISFLMQYSRMDFIEAVEKLAQLAGLQIPYGSNGTKDSPALHKKLIQVMETAANFFHENLYETSISIEYLKRRGIKKKIAKRFKIGYAPPGYDNIKSLFKKDYDEELLSRAGLLTAKDNRHYARFRNRLIFPIRNPRGQTIAFGGRVLADSEQPKYLNSPETPIFRKRRTLYGVHELRHVKKLEHILVVEGYMDTVALAQHGIENVAATLGTAITSEHARQLLRTCNVLKFCFDGDAAGYKAAIDAMQQVLPVFKDGYDIRFTLLPEGEDPDSLITKQGREAFEALTQKAIPLSNFLFRHLTKDSDLTSPEGRASFGAHARPMLAKVPNGTFRDLLIEDLAMRSGLSTEHLKFAPNTIPTLHKALSHRLKRRYSATRVSAALLTGNPELVHKALPGDKIRQLSQPDSLILADLIDAIRTHQVTTTAALLELYRDHKYQSIISELATWPPPPKDHIEFEHCMEHLEKSLDKQREELLIEKAGRGELAADEKAELQTLQKANKAMQK